MLHEDTKNSQIKGEKQLDSLADALELLSAKFDELDKDKKILNLRKMLIR